MEERTSSAHTRWEHFLYYFFRRQWCPGRILFSITGIKVMISGIAFDRPDRLRMFPYDRFKIYTTVSIVRIDLNSIHSIEVVSIVWIVCDRPDNVSIWSSRSSEHYLRRLGRETKIKTRFPLSSLLRKVSNIKWMYDPAHLNSFINKSSS